MLLLCKFRSKDERVVRKLFKLIENNPTLIKDSFYVLKSFELEDNS